MLPYPARSMCNSFSVTLPLGKDRSLLCTISLPGLAPQWLFAGLQWTLLREGGPDRSPPTPAPRGVSLAVGV